MKEIIVFLPYDPKRLPLEVAREMAERLDTGRVEVGVDALTGGVEVRLFYDETLLRQIREYLTEQGIPFDINLL